MGTGDSVKMSVDCYPWHNGKALDYFKLANEHDSIQIISFRNFF